MVNRFRQCNRQIRSAAGLLLITAALSACNSVHHKPPAQPSHPNVLFLAVDDLNDWTGFQGGHPDAQTPHMDQLAARSVVFTHAYCSAPVCNPSRTSLLSGFRPTTSGIYSNQHDAVPFLHHIVTLPEYFKQHGYTVLGGGKIFHRDHNAKSWHTFYPRTRDPLPAQRPLNGIPHTKIFDWGPLDCKDDDLFDGKLALWAKDVLHTTHDRPFFLAVGFFRPHLPWYVPKKYFDMYDIQAIRLPVVNDHDLDDVPEMGRRFANPDGDHKRIHETGNFRNAVHAYLASISYADACVGIVLDALEHSPYRDNTIVILWGDHGWHLDEKHRWRKSTLWEEATRTTLLLHAPHAQTRPHIYDKTVSLLDIYPTLIDLCHLPIKTDLEGVNLLPLLQDRTRTRDPVLTTCWGYNKTVNIAVRSNQFRYIRYHDGSEELYNHDLDPLEWTNLANDVRYQHVIQNLSRWIPESYAAPAPTIHHQTAR